MYKLSKVKNGDKSDDLYELELPEKQRLTYPELKQMLAEMNQYIADNNDHKAYRVTVQYTGNNHYFSGELRVQIYYASSAGQAREQLHNDPDYPYGYLKAVGIPADEREHCTFEITRATGFGNQVDPLEDGWYYLTAEQRDWEKFDEYYPVKLTDDLWATSKNAFNLISDGYTFAELRELAKEGALKLSGDSLRVDTDK